MSKYFSVHARERAQERYGLDLSHHEMFEIIRACRDGRASMMAANEQGEVFVWRIRGVVIIPVLTESRGFIVTFQPHDYFTAGAHLRRFKTKTKPSMPSHLDGREYRRAKSNRRAFDDLAGEP